MMDTQNIQQAEAARKRGNELYKSHQFGQAIEAYKQAAAFAPLDPYPLSNISIASFEAGKYAHCIHFSTKALGLLNADDPKFDVSRQRLLVRQAKAYLHLSLLREAEKLLDQLGSSAETEDLRKSLRATKELTMPSTRPALLREAVLQLPRLRPRIQDEPEYYGPGHDDATSLYTADLEKSTDQDPVLSVMLCGVGDARHLFQTLIRYSSRNKGVQKLHVTMLDHKPAVIARDLIFFSLLQEATTNQESKDTALLSLGYLYCAPIIPPFAREKLQNTISKLLDKLEKEQQPFNLVYLPMPQRGIVRSLKSWQTGAATKYATSEMRRVASRKTIEKLLNMDCQADYEDFENFSVVFPPEAILVGFEPELSALVAAYRNHKKGARVRVGEYLDKHWKVNVTLIDVDWEAVKRPGEQPHVGLDPFQIVGDLTKQFSKLTTSNRSSSCILQHAADFFERVGMSVLQLQGRLTVEVILGDMADVLERIRYGVLNRPAKGTRTTTEWPDKYHVIHMSNVPDYVGGSLTSFLYATPLLKQGSGTGLLSCALLNASYWEGLKNFNAEYLLMHDPIMIRKHFSVELAEVENGGTNLDRFSMLFYHRWERCNSDTTPLERLMSKTDLSRWLHAHFLKICLPFRRPTTTLVYAPLNMTMFMRLLTLMGELGYPGHWLSDIIKSLGSGEIKTAARAPRKFLLNPTIVDGVHPLRTMCVKPWNAEFTTLVTQWRDLFRFTTVMSGGILPPPEIIMEYSIKVPLVGADGLQQPHFMLVFWNQRKYGELMGDIYQLLLDDENGDTTSSARNIRSDGIHILSTFKCVSKEMMATFWLRSDVVNLMLKEDWSVYIWRTSTWNRYTPGQPLREYLSKKRTWKECVTSA
ncbi:uncharacterized protein F4807DRAFT_193787 [Annulohypoxylon truncatum]|uniref:uncharacterized protein n=1 Tax=Annulohypoxylon truncatum TaxID=327061 RepID=UPI002007C67A|nr:uncharacterized protein F4807DRAFT_193787 [Annulohypoxylon truncatum]KAI1213605.1 hypothetical protein F4807DRAFT_193787 [Annulohypoxylon truncatum]